MDLYIRSTLAHIRTLLVPSFLRPGWTYTHVDAQSDIFAGITVALIQIPQSMAFALIAGLPAIYGLYASLAGSVAGIFGNSRYLSTGPVAIISFLTFTSLVPLSTPGSEAYIHLASTLAFLVGGIYLMMGFFRLGFILQLVPHSVIAGFSSAAAVIIVISQIPTLLGISIPANDLILSNVLAIIRNVPALSFATFCIGVSTIFILFFAKKFSPRIPGALIVLVLGIYGGYIFSIEGHTLAVVGSILPVLPTFFLPTLSVYSLFALIPKAGIIALVGYVYTHATVKSISKSKKEHVDTNQELVGQGIANIVGAFFRAYPLSGSITRTAINIESGARTEMASIYTALFTIFAILFLSPLFLYLPKAVLASIVIMSAFPLIHISRLKDIFRIDKTDGYIAWITFIMVFVFKPDDALFIGVVLALMLFIQKTVWRETVTEVGIDRTFAILRGEIDEEDVEIIHGVVMVRVGVSMYYANAAHLLKAIHALIIQHEVRERTQVHTLVLAMSGVGFIDITGIEELEEYCTDLHDRHIHIVTIYLRTAIRDTLKSIPNFPHFTDVHNIKEMLQEVQRHRSPSRLV